jgi:hypothetical protein
MPLVVLAVAAIALEQSWARWLDPIIDAGRDLYIPGALLGGARLYRDIRYEYLPLAPYLLALIRRVIGGRLPAYIAIGIVQSAIVAFALWRLAQSAVADDSNVEFHRKLAGTTAAAFFTAFSLAGATTWGANFIFPYSHAATLGMALYLLYALALRRYLFVARSGRWFALSLLIALASGWCKVEYALAIAATFVLMAIVHRLPWRDWLLAAASTATTFAGASLFFRDARPGHHWLRDNIFAASLLRGDVARQFYATAAGTASASRAILEMIVAALLLVGFAALLRRAGADRLWRAPAAAVSVALGVGAIATGLHNAFFRGWSLLIALALVYALVRERRGELCFLSAFCLAAAMRIPLNIAPEWYGFVLAVPCFAVIAFMAFEELPRRGIYSRRAALLWLPLIAALCLSALRQQHERYLAKQFAIHTPQGTLLDHNPDRAAILNTFIATVSAGGGGRTDRTLAVLPEGVTLNYLTGLPTTLSFHTFTPPETADPRIDAQIAREIAERGPDLVAIVSRDLREFGSEGIGIDYDPLVMSALREHYRPAAKWNLPRFSLLLLRRADGGNKIDIAVNRPTRSR